MAAGPIKIAILSNGSAARADIGKTGKSLGVLGTNASKAGALLRKGLAIGALGAVAGVGKFTKDAAVLDTKMREVVTLLGETGKAADKSLTRIQGQVKGLSNEFGIAQETLTGGLYSAISAGVPKDNALKFMQVASKAAIAGVTDVETTVDGLSSIINAFGLEASDAQKVSDSLFSAVKGGKTTFGELSDSIFNIAPAAAAAKVSFQEVNAAIATLTAGGTPTSVATTQIRAALVGLQKPSAELDSIFQSLGYENAQLAVEQKGLKFALTAVKDASKGNNGALQTLLGSTEAVSAANVLAGTGAKKFSDELRAQKGAAGASADAFAIVNKGAERQFEILKTNLRNTGLSIGQALLPALTKLSGFLLDKAVPAIEGLVKKLEDNKDEFRSFGQTLTTAILPPLKTLGSIAVSVAGFLNDLPGPVKSIGIQAGIAAIVLGRLSTAATVVATRMGLAGVSATAMGTAMTTSAGRAKLLQGALARVGGIARGAAGVGGLLALSQGAQTSNSALKTLANVGGGALLGFSLGGPIGAAIGATAGGLLSLKNRAKEAGSAAESSTTNWEGLAATLDGVTGATTEATRAFVYDKLEREGAFKVLEAEGISRRQAVDAVLGDTAARKGNLAIVKSQKAEYDTAAASILRLEDAYVGLLNKGQIPESDQMLRNIGRMKREQATRRESIGILKGTISSIQGELRANGARANAITDYTRRLKGVPRKVKTRLEQLNYAPSIKNVAALANRYKLTPKKVSTIITATNAKFTRQEVEKVQRALKETGKTKADLGPYRRSVRGGVDGASKLAKGGSDSVRKGLEKGPKDAKANLSGYQGSVRSETNAAAGIASTGGNSVGFSLKSGTLAGLSGLVGSLSGAVSGAVNAAIRAGKAAAQSRSPSRRMMRLGNDLGMGLVIGTNARRKAAKRAGRRLVFSLFSGVTGGSTGISKQLSRVESQIEKSFRKRFKKSGQAEKRTRVALRGLKDEFKALKRNGKAQDRLNSKLTQARDKFKAAQQAAAEYASTVKGGIVSSGSVVGLGGNDDDQSVAIGGLIDQLKQKVENARRYSSLIASLTKSKLNKTSLQQIIDAGVDGGLATAEALASGGRAAISQVNSLTSELTKVGSTLGDSTSKTMHAAGVAAAQGLVRGLVSQERRLDRAAKRLANKLTRAMKKALGIRSPSTVFRGMGLESVKGLDIGLDDTYVRRSGEQLAGSLVKGFGTPALDAYASSAARTGGGQELTINLTVNVPVGASAAETGRQIVKSIDAYRRSGGRMAAV